MSALARFIPRRFTEATQQQRIATGASGGNGWADGIDTDAGSFGFRSAGVNGPREVPERTRDTARTDSVAAHRANPMGRAIIDTYVAFMVGDSGVSLNCTSDQVRAVAESFWHDPKNRLPDGQELMARSWLLMGEALYEMMVGGTTGVTRRSVIDPTRIVSVDLEHGNPLWVDAVWIKTEGEPKRVEIVRPSDLSGLLTGDALFWPGFRTLETDTRGTPFLMPVLDWLDSYDNVLSNLIDRTALARYLAYQVKVGNDPAAVDKYLEDRGGNHLPRSGTIEVTTDNVDIKSLNGQAGAYEDTTTGKAVLTVVAGGAGLSKVWLAEPEDANRATSLSMAEPVRRRIGSVQNEWLANLTQMVRFAVDQAVAAGRIPEMVEIDTPSGPVLVAAADTVTVTGPQVAAADAKVTAEVLKSLSESLRGMTDAGLLSQDAGRVAAQKAWEQFVGVPYRAELDTEEADADNLAEHIDDNGGDLGELTAV